jgi:hypothetical protein
MRCTWRPALLLLVCGLRGAAPALDGVTDDDHPHVLVKFAEKPLVFRHASGGSGSMTLSFHLDGAVPGFAYRVITQELDPGTREPRQHRLTNLTFSSSGDSVRVELPIPDARQARFFFRIHVWDAAASLGPEEGGHRSAMGLLSSKLASWPLVYDWRDMTASLRALRRDAHRNHTLAAEHATPPGGAPVDTTMRHRAIGRWRESARARRAAAAATAQQHACNNASIAADGDADATGRARRHETGADVDDGADAKTVIAICACVTSKARILQTCQFVHVCVCVCVCMDVCMHVCMHACVSYTHKHTHTYTHTHTHTHMRAYINTYMHAYSPGSLRCGTLENWPIVGLSPLLRTSRPRRCRASSCRPCETLSHRPSARGRHVFRV